MQVKLFFAVLVNLGPPVATTTIPLIRKLTLSIEEEGGIIFASSNEFDDLFIAVKSRDDLRRAIDTCLQNAFAQRGEQVKVYMNCQLNGPVIDALVEVTQLPAP